MNNKGLVCLSMPIVLGYMLLTGMTASLLTYKTFRVKKVIKKCEASEHVSEISCEDIAKNMTDEEVLIYIKDNDTKGNEGYITDNR